MTRTKADRLADFINLIVRAGCQDDLSDQGVCLLALDLDPDAYFFFYQGYFTISFSDRSRITYDQVPTCQSLTTSASRLSTPLTTPSPAP